jgi:hypothetical protein
MHFVRGSSLALARHMKSWLLLAVLWMSAGDAATTGYFIKLESEAEYRAEVVLQFGDHTFGPQQVRKHGGATYGPMSSRVPGEVKITWRLADGPEHTEVVKLSEQVPEEFEANDAIVFRMTADQRMGVFFSCKVDPFRAVEIPLHETSEAARARELNEALLKAAGLGQLERVEALLRRGADPNYLLGGIHATPVRYAANGGHLEVVDFLLKSGAKLQRRDLVIPYLSSQAKLLGIEVK